MALEAIVGEDPSQVGMVGEENAIHVPHLRRGRKERIGLVPRPRSGLGMRPRKDIQVLHVSHDSVFFFVNIHTQLVSRPSGSTAFYLVAVER